MEEKRVEQIGFTHVMQAFAKSIESMKLEYSAQVYNEKATFPFKTLPSFCYNFLKTNGIFIMQAPINATNALGYDKENRTFTAAFEQGEGQ